jgi:uncharacterized protein (DUF983 family)
MPATAKRSVWVGLQRGLQRKCPHCGEGALFAGYLKVAPTCASCGHNNGRYRADDGPAYLTVLLMGHFLVAPALMFPIIWQADPLIVVPIALVTVTAVTLAMLGCIKGAWIGLIWANGSEATSQ